MRQMPHISTHLLPPLAAATTAATTAGHHSSHRSSHHSAPLNLCPLSAPQHACLSHPRCAGQLLLTTEFGLLEVAPGEIVVVPRGVRFSVALPAGPARGYVLEVFQGAFRLPDLGPIGGWASWGVKWCGVGGVCCARVGCLAACACAGVIGMW